nr:hypothetical protein [Veillonella denticariosi]
MIGLLRRWFSIDAVLPYEARKGPVGSTKELYGRYLKIAWPATLQGLMLQFMTAIDLAMVGSLGGAGGRWHLRA